MTHPNAPPSTLPFRIVYEDEDLLALEKPAGIPTQATVDKNRPNFYTLAQIQYGKALYLHHRLDKDTSGIIILSKSQRMNPLLADLFQKHEIRKTYWALSKCQVANRHVPETWTVENFLELQKKQKPQLMKSVHRGGLKAITEFQVLERFSNSKGQAALNLLECRPRTGRTHQIRVHLAELSMPILGDSLYGGQDSSVPRLMLHAAELQFKHPISHQPIQIHCELAQDFKSVITRLKIL